MGFRSWDAGPGSSASFHVSLKMPSPLRGLSLHIRLRVAAWDDLKYPPPQHPSYHHLWLWKRTVMERTENKGKRQWSGRKLVQAENPGQQCNPKNMAGGGIARACFSVSQFPSPILERQHLQSFLHIGISDSKSALSPTIGSQSP